MTSAVCSCRASTNTADRRKAPPLLTPLVGLSSVDDFYELTVRLMVSIESRQPLSDLDWARALVLTEISFASDALGSGLDFATCMRDEKAIVVLRDLQYKLSDGHRFQLLRDNAILP